MQDVSDLLSPLLVSSVPCLPSFMSPGPVITPLHSSLFLLPQQHDHLILPKAVLSLCLPQAAELARENPTITMTRHMLRSCPKSSKGAQQQPVTLRDTQKSVQSEKSHQGNDGRNPRTKETYWCLVQNCLSLITLSQYFHGSRAKKKYPNSYIFHLLVDMNSLNQAQTPKDFL